MRPRVSILNLLLVTTIVALVIVVVRLYHELDHERSLRLQLLQKGGILQVTDLDVVHVVKVDTDESDGTLSWRVYVPKGRSVILNVRLNTMPDDKIVPRLPPNAIVVADRSPSNPIDLGPGEHVVSLSWAQGKPRFTLDVVRNGFTAHAALQFARRPQLGMEPGISDGRHARRTHTNYQSRADKTARP